MELVRGADVVRVVDAAEAPDMGPLLSPATRPATSSGVMNIERAKRPRFFVVVDMGFPSRASEVSCRVREEVARPLTRLHSEDQSWTGPMVGPLLLPLRIDSDTGGQDSAHSSPD